MNIIRKTVLLVALSGLLVPVYAQNIGVSVGPDGVRVHHGRVDHERHHDRFHHVVDDRDLDRHHHRKVWVNGHREHWVNGHRVVVNNRGDRYYRHHDMHETSNHRGHRDGRDHVVWVR